MVLGDGFGIKNPRVKRVRRVVAAMWMITSSLAAAGTAIPAYAQQATRSFDIPAQPLATALAAFGQQSGLQVSAQAPLIEGRTSSAVRGALSPMQALSQLLAGTGLTFRVVGSTVTLEPAPQTSGDAIQLGPVRVEGEGAARGMFSASAAGTGTTANGYVSEQPAAIGPWEGRSVQDTPYSVAIVPAELIENVQALTPDQLYRLSPTMQLSWPQSQNDTPSVYMRGFSINPPARNGLQGGMYSHASTTEDIERIEILTGLSGFLYGPGNVGGIINYISKRPTAERYNAVTLGYAGGSNFYAQGDFGGPIDTDGRLGYRINAIVQDGDTVIEDYGLRKYFISGAFDWKPTERLLLQIDGSYRDYRSQRQAYWGLAAGVARPSADSIDPNILWSQKWAYQDVESSRLGANLRWEAADAITLRAAWLNRRDLREYALPINSIQADGTYNQISYQTPPQDVRGRAWNAYADFAFSTGTIEHKLTAGYLTTRTTRYDHQDGEVSVNTLDGQPLSTPSYVPEPDWPSHGQLPRFNGLIGRQQSWTIGDDITLTDQFSILAGVTHATISQERRSGPTAAWTQTYEKSAVTPTASLIYKPAPTITLYTTYMESLEQGGEAAEQFGGYPVVNAREVLSPLMSDQIEAGVKATVGGMLLTGALFRIDKGLQYYDVTDPTRPIYVQDGRQVHQGAELTATGKLTPDLTLIGGVTLLDAKVKDQKQNPALEGNRPAGVSEHMIKLYAEYDIVPVPGLTLTGGVSYVGAAWANATNTDRLPGYAIIDAGVRYMIDAGGKPLMLRLNVTNLANERYWINSQYLGDARTVLASASIKF